MEGVSKEGSVIAVTEGEGLEGPLAAALASRGAKVLALPTVRIEAPGDLGPLDRALGALERFDWIVFTSRHAVDAVDHRPAWQAARQRILPALRVAAVGRSTAARLAQLGVVVDLVPDEAGAAALADLLVSNRVETGGGRGFRALSALSSSAGGPFSLRTGGREVLDSRMPDAPPREDPPPCDPDASPHDPLAPPRDPEAPLAGVRILWPRSDIARRELASSLREAGAEVVEPVVYRTIATSGDSVNEVLRRLESGEIGAVTFMSPSSARNLAALTGRADLAHIASRTIVASIGPTTSDALRELAAPPQVESSARTAEDLAKTLVAYLESHPRVSP